MVDTQNNVIVNFLTEVNSASLEVLKTQLSDLNNQIKITKSNLSMDTIKFNESKANLEDLKNNLKEVTSIFEKDYRFNTTISPDVRDEAREQKKLMEELTKQKQEELAKSHLELQNQRESIKLLLQKKQIVSETLKERLKKPEVMTSLDASGQLQKVDPMPKFDLEMGKVDIPKEIVSEFKLEGFEVANQKVKELKEGMTQVTTTFKNETGEITKTLNEQLDSSGQLLKRTFSVDTKPSANIIDTKNLEIAQDLMKRTGLEANALTIGLKRLGMTIKGGKIIGPFNKEIKVAEINLKKLKAASVQFKMSLLSVMFAGMALQRAMGKALRSMITTYQKANEDSEGLGKSTWHLLAAWEFLKYSIIDALTQSDLFKLLVHWLLQVVNWFNKLSPDKKAMIGIGIALLFVVGTIMMIVGQIGLAINGFAALGFAAPKSLAGLFLTLIKIAVWAFVIVGVIWGISDAFKILGDNSKDLGKNTNEASFSILGLLKVIFLLFTKAVSGVVILGGSIIASIVFVMALVVDTIWTSLKYIGYGFAWVFQQGDYFFKKLANSIVDPMTKALNWVIRLINNVIDGWNNLPYTKKVPNIPEVGLGFRFDLEKERAQIAELEEKMSDLKPDFNMRWENFNQNFKEQLSGVWGDWWNSLPELDQLKEMVMPKPAIEASKSMTDSMDNLNKSIEDFIKQIDVEGLRDGEVKYDNRTQSLSVGDIYMGIPTGADGNAIRDIVREELSNLADELNKTNDSAIS